MSDEKAAEKRRENEEEDEEEEDPATCVELLNEQLPFDISREVRGTLEHSTKEWKQEFAEEKGLEAIAKFLVNEKIGETIRREILAILEYFLDDPDLVRLVLATPYLIPSVVLCAGNHAPPLRYKALAVLTFLVWVPEGRVAVLDATTLNKAYGLKHMIKNLPKNSKDNGEVVVDDIVFINSFINSCTSRASRIHFRAFLHGMGLDEKIEELYGMIEEGSPAHKRLEYQLEVYDGGIINDSHEQTLSMIDANNPDAWFAVLKEMAIGENCLQHLLSILQMLCTIPHKSPQIWRVTEHIVGEATHQEVSEQGEVSFDALRTKLKKKEKEIEQQEVSKIKEMKEKMEQQRAELHKLRMRGEHTEDLKNKIKLLEATIAHLNQPNRRTKERQLSPTVATKEPTASAAADTSSVSDVSLSTESGHVPSLADPELASLLQDQTLPDKAKQALQKLHAEVVRLTSPSPPQLSIIIEDASEYTSTSPPAVVPIVPALPPPVPPSPASLMDRNAPTPDKLGLHPKVEIKPTRSLKLLHWKTVPLQAIESTVWSQLDDSDLLKSMTEGEFKEDVKLFEELFASKPSVKKKEVMAEEKAETKAKKSQLITVIDDKQRNLVDITLARFRMPNEHVRDAILGMDFQADGGLDADKLQQLIPIVPSEDLLATLSDYEEDQESLAKAERFLLCVGPIPRLKKRLELTIFQQTFPSSAAELDKSIKLVETALTSLRDAKNLQQLFRIVLAFGNYMNAGTNKGAAYGFRLQTLIMLSKHKSADNSTDFLVFLVKWLKKNKEKFPDILRFKDEIAPCKAVGRIEQKHLVSQVNQMTGTLNIMEKELKETFNPSVDRFQAVMSLFHKGALAQVQAFKKRVQQTEEDYHKLTAFYGEIGQEDMEWQEFFQQFESFGTAFDKAEKRLEEEDEKETRQLKRQKWIEEQKTTVKHKHVRTHSNPIDVSLLKTKRASRLLILAQKQRQGNTLAVPTS